MNDNPLCQLSDAEIAALYNAGEPLERIGARAGIKVKALRQRLVHLGFLKAKTFRIVDSRVTVDKNGADLLVTWSIRHDEEKYQVSIRQRNFASGGPLVDVQILHDGTELYRLPWEPKDFDSFDPVKLLKGILAED